MSARRRLQLLQWSLCGHVERRQLDRHRARSGCASLVEPVPGQQQTFELGKSMKSQKEIELNELPELGDETGIFAFAMTFDGYEAMGSFEAAANAAHQRKRESLGKR